MKDTYRAHLLYIHIYIYIINKTLYTLYEVSSMAQLWGSYEIGVRTIARAGFVALRLMDPDQQSSYKLQQQP